MFVNKSISCISSVLFVVVFMLTVTPFQAVYAVGVHFAKPAASGTGNCLSWANACTLQTALTGATSGDEVWVMAGTYKPTTVGTDRTTAFRLIDGIAVYGGFAGTETTRDQRNPATNVTILSGDIDNNDSQTPIITDITTVTGNTTNSYHVVFGATGATIDGFTITAGYIHYDDDSTGFNVYGAGIYNLTSSPTVKNVIFIGNMASRGGAGMFNKDSSNPILTNVTFIGNKSDVGGGGMFNWYSSPVLVDVGFSQNSGMEGGAMYNYYSHPSLTRVTFSGNLARANGGGMGNLFNSHPDLVDVTFNGNTAMNFGGGMYNVTNSNPTLTRVTLSGNMADSGGGLYNRESSRPSLTDVNFYDNSARYGGGLFNDSHSSPILNKVTFSDNSATINGGGICSVENSYGTVTNATFKSNSAKYGGGIYNHTADTVFRYVTLNDNSAEYGGGIYTTNSYPEFSGMILWGNTASVDGSQIFDAYSTAGVFDSVIEGGLEGGTNILSTDPLLGAFGNHGGFTQTIPIRIGSSAIDKAEDSNCPTTDQRGVSRPQGAHCDIGAFEVKIYSIYLSLVVH
jgi:predicted outer membrane repeat protein